MQSANRKQSLIDRSVLPRHLCTVSISAVLVSFPDQYDAMFIALYKQAHTCISLVFRMLNLRIRALIRNVALLLLTVHRYTLVVHLASHFTHDVYRAAKSHALGWRHTHLLLFSSSHAHLLKSPAFLFLRMRINLE